ncbi:hypothetical protein AB1Y20_014541 [Prymnesium parvum]|uniref:Branchpoint-bridging protein n=1 Tax=Prymnesium parvum TaxID=97485 RepID=A0AB34ID75_PRYPA
MSADAPLNNMPDEGAPSPAQEEGGTTADTNTARRATDEAPATAAETGSAKQRRSRWGGKALAEDSGGADEGGAKKRSRWGTKTQQVVDPVVLAVQLGLPLATLQHMSAEQQEMLPQLKKKIDEIDILLRLPDCGVSEIPLERRSPSPDPIFDKTGTRVNSREARRRQELERERAELMDSLKPKAPQRQWRKIMVPVDKYPGYNFFGALIGPRGNAQKRMERESGCKIVIRGKGAIKDGMGRHDGKPLGPEDDEPMHVLIEGPDEESVEKGQEMVEQVLNPYSDGAVQQKEKQMRELAIINGTLKEEEAGVNPATWGNAAAKGALFNPARAGAHSSCGASAPAMDDEYASFMAELGAPPGPRPPAPWAAPPGAMPPRPPPGPYGLPPVPPGMPMRPPGPPGWQSMPPSFAAPPGYPPMGMMRPPSYGPPGFGAPPPQGYPVPPPGFGMSNTLDIPPPPPPDDIPPPPPPPPDE